MEVQQLLVRQALLTTQTTTSHAMPADGPSQGQGNIR